MIVKSLEVKIYKYMTIGSSNFSTEMTLTRRSWSNSGTKMLKTSKTVNIKVTEVCSPKVPNKNGASLLL